MSIQIIMRVLYNFPTSVLLSLYYTMVHPYYEYCNIIWANVKTRYVDKLSTSQRKILRIVFKLKWNDNIDDICVKCNLLNNTGIHTNQTYCSLLDHHAPSSPKPINRLTLLPLLRSSLKSAVLTLWTPGAGIPVFRNL